MFDQYSDIFDRRGREYHQAMVAQPLARAEEFRHIIDIAALKPGLRVFDLPSGGGYLKHFFNCLVDITEVETSKAFHELACHDRSVTHLLCEDISQVPAPDHSVDRVLSLSGLHHIEQRAPFYQEAWRLLKPNGLLCIGDVAKGSNADRFLNDFVDQNGSQGHVGLFLNNEDIQLIESTGFKVNSSVHQRYHWRFSDIAQMVWFVKKLFGIDKCNDSKVLQGIEEHLGFDTFNNKILMEWSLQYIQAKRSAD